MTGIESGGSHPPELPPMTWGDPPSAAAGPGALPPVPWGWWEPFIVFVLTFFTSGLLSVAIAA